MTKSNNTTTIVIIIVIAVIAIVALNKFKQPMNITLNQTTLQLIQQGQQPGDICTMSITPSTMVAGGTASGTITDGPNTFCETFANYNNLGWTKVWEGYTNANGIVTDSDVLNLVGNYIFISVCGGCVTNTDTIIVTALPPPPFPGYNPGDIVGGGSVSGGNLAGGDSGQSWDIDLSSVQTGGPYCLGARIQTDWNYANPYCTGLQGFTGVTWNLYDSSSSSIPAWTRTDSVPIGLDVEVCPLNYDGVNNWRFEMLKTLNLPECALSYNWDVDVFVCEC